MRLKTVCLVAALFLCAPFIFPNSVNMDSSRRSADPAAYRVVVPPFASAPKIDGKLDDPFWESAAVLESFTQYEPVEGSEPTERTVAYIGYDKNNLYIGVRCYDSNPKAVRACLTQRDMVRGDDEVTVYLDTFNDKKRAFAFLVNPCGVQSDGIYVESGGGRRGRGRGGGGGFDRIDKTWDTYFTTDANMDDEGYSVEMAIPFKSLRFPHSQPQLWGMQIKRNIRRKNEEIYWYPRSRDINGFLIQAGTIQIDGSLNKGKNFEVMPVVTGLKEQGQKADPQAGLNLKYGITSDLTADATINPDFSQVEADMPQIEVNQRYALYYPEKRPFFLEGKDYFDTPIELMYTRTIVDPAWGFKLTGKMGRTTMGVLSTYDLNPTGIDVPGEDEEEDEEDEEEDITQRSLVNVFRLKQDLFTESYIGLIFADKEMGQSWDTITTDYNRVGGVDGHFKFWNNYRFSFQIVGSQTKVGEYKSSLIPAAKLNFSARGRHLSFSADYSHIPPDFEASSGFFRRKDVKSFHSRLGYAFLPMNDLIVDIRPSLQYRRIYDFNNVLTDEEYEFSFFMSGWRGTFISAGFSRNFERYEGVDFWRNNFRTWIRSEPLSWLTGGVNFSMGESIYYDENPYLGFKYSYGFNLTFKPLTNLRLFYNFRNDTFYKSKGGELEYRVNILTQRISYQITRHLSLRLITDYNDYNKELYNSILLSYQLNPGTVFYVGVDDNQEQDDLGIYRVEGRFFFVKFSYWWRI